MKIDKVEIKNHIVMPEGVNSNDKIGFTKIPIEKANLIVVVVGNDQYVATPTDVKNAYGNFLAAHKLYDLCETLVIDNSIKDFTFSNNPDIKNKKPLWLSTHYFDENVFYEKLNKLSIGEMLDNFLITQIGSPSTPATEKETDKFVDKMVRHVNQGVANNIKGICIHKCLNVYAFS